MSAISKASPADRERLVLLRLLDAEHIDSKTRDAARADFIAQLGNVLNSGVPLGYTATLIRDYREGEDLLLFQLPGRLVLGQVADARKAHGTSTRTSTGTMSARPGIYLSDE